MTKAELENRIVRLAGALEWALHNVRMPDGVDPERWAGQYNQAVDVYMDNETDVGLEEWYYD